MDMELNGREGLICSFFEILNSKDVRSLGEKLAPTVEFIFPLSLPYGGVWKGYEKVKESLNLAFTYLGFTQFEIQEYIFHNDSVICTGTFNIEDSKFMFIDVFTIQNNRILKRLHFVDTALIINTFTKNFL
ncbi:MAG: nuclear transport factor 2 family protein [Bacteroidia bacterium]